MTLNYAEQWQPNLLEVIIGDTYISPFIRSNVKWLNAKTFHFTQMATSGYQNHTRDAGWNSGTYQQQDVPFTVMHDRDIEFMIDKADVDETNATASIQNISSIFLKWMPNSSRRLQQRLYLFRDKIHQQKKLILHLKLYCHT